MAGTNWVALALWAAGALALACVVVLYFALLHDRSRGRRRCPKCWYNLSGNLATRTCSECGYTAAHERALFRTRRRPWWAAFGCLLLAASVALPSRADLQQFKPVWLLTSEMYAAGQRGEDARRELISRGRNDRLSIRQQRRLADHVLAIQANSEADWLQRMFPTARDASWAPMFEEAWQRGSLRDDQVQQYFRNAFEMTFQVEHRRRVRAGAYIPIRFKNGEARVYRWSHMDALVPSPVSLRVRLASVEGLDPEQQELPSMFGRGHRPGDRAQANQITARVPRDFSLGSSHSAGAASQSLLAPIHTLGEREIVLHLEFGVFVNPGRRTLYTADYDFDAAIVRWQRTVRCVVEVVPRDEPTVSMVDDPSLEQEIRQLLQVHLLSPRLEIQGSIYGGRYGMVLVHPVVPVNLGFDVFARVGNTEQWVGTMRAHANRPRIQNAQGIDIDVQQLFDADIVDVILRANPEAAERTIDIFDIWNGTIEIENVPLRDLR